MHSNREYFWCVYELNEYLAKICMHLLLRPLLTTVTPSLPYNYNIIYYTPKKTYSALANITSIKRILMAI